MIQRIALADVLNAGSTGSSVLLGSDVTASNTDAQARDPADAAIPGILDTVFTYVSFSIEGLTFVENLTLVGPGRLNGTGNALANVLTGGEGSNRLNALGGDDTVIGLAGDDTLAGMDGSDALDGGAGNDYVTGGNGGDVLSRSYGDDRLAGNGGNDFLEDVDGSNVLLGGAGNDVLLVHVNSGRTRADGGGGEDTYLLVASYGNRGYLISGFQSGDGGDLIDVNDLLRQSSDFGYEGGDPTAAGFLRFNQSGGDALLQWDPDGSLSVYGWSTQLTLLGVNAGDPASSLVGIPSAAPSAGETVAGGTLSDMLVGSGFADGLSGAGGADTLDGAYGDDHLFGGPGNDLLLGGGGNDTIFGEGGNDEFSAERSFGDDFLDGGAGNDVFRDFAGRNTMRGGDGNDLFHVFAYTNGMEAGSTASGGAGRDTYEVEGSGASRAYVVTDFQGGRSGDRIDVSRLLADSADYGYDGTNSSQFVRLFQSGEDALLQWDADGAATGTTWLTMLTLQGIDAGSITKDNFGKNVIGAGGHDVLFGGLGNDSISSHEGNDTLEGAEGDDILDGGIGRDVLMGGAGADTYYVDDLGDSVVETSNDAPGALLLPSDGAGLLDVARIGDTIIAAINYSLSTLDLVENLTLNKGASEGSGNLLANRIKGNAGSDTLIGGAGDDTIDGGRDADYILAGDDDDFVIWDRADKVDGGNDTDTLVIRTGDLDLTTIGNTRIQNIEVIDMRGGGNNRLKLGVLDLLDISSTTDTLRILGSAGDSVDIVGTFTSGTVIGGFRTYNVGTGTLLVDTDITNVM